MSKAIWKCIVPKTDGKIFMNYDCKIIKFDGKGNALIQIQGSNTAKKIPVDQLIIVRK